MKKLSPVSAGQPITAALVNRLIEGYNQLQSLSVSAPLQMMHLSGGIQLGLRQQTTQQALFEIVGLAGATPGNGTGADDIRYWRAKQVIFDSSGLYTVAPGSAPYTHIVYDPLRVYAGKTLARWHAAFFNTHTSHWELLPGFVGGKWGKAISRWQNGNHPYVEVNPCNDALGNGADTSTVLAVALPKMAGKDPNVRTGDVVAYTQVGTGTGNTSNLCISNYLDDKLGTIKLWRNAISSIPAGWALADGVANSIANGGSGQNLTGRFLVGYKAGDPDYFQIGNTGGAVSHQHGLGSTAGTNALATNAGNSGPGYLTSQVDSRPPWYTIAFIERVV